MGGEIYFGTALGEMLIRFNDRYCEFRLFFNVSF